MVSTGVTHPRQPRLSRLAALRRHPVFRNDSLTALGLMVLCWVFYFFTKLIFDLVMVDNAFSFIPGRLLVITVGCALSFCMYLVLRTFWGRSVVLISLLVVATSSIAAIPFAMFNWWMLKTFSSTDQTMLFHTMIAWSASVHLYFAQAVAIVAFLYARQLRHQEAEAIHAEKNLRQAELRALRYQVNPHFLFNALNSVSSLLTSRRPAEAERMIDMLADYYERALTASHDELVPVAREIEAQLQYLDIERIRFPDRLTVEVDLPRELETALVPTLMIQPLIENSIKHGVAASVTRVTIRIAVSRDRNHLRISVSERGREPDHSPVQGAGTGTGLRNIRNRLSAFYGEDAALDAGPLPGGFRSELTIPLRFREGEHAGLPRG